MLVANKRKFSKITEFQKKDHEVVIQTEKGKLKLVPYSDSIIRVIYTLSEEFPSTQGMGLVPMSPHCAFEVEETSTTLVLITSKLKVELDKQTCAIRYLTKDNALLVKEPDLGGKTLEGFDAYKPVFDDDTVTEKIVTPDGVKEVIRDGKKSFYKKLYHTKLELEWSEEEAIYGFGQQQEGSLNLRGTRQYIHQANMKAAMPFFLSTKGYGILFDTYSPMIFNDTEYGSYLYNEAANELDFYFIYGENFDQIISGYRTLSGKATMLPMWAFGYMQSQERYESQEEIINTVMEYRKRKIPIDSIVLDWMSWEDGKWGQKTFDLTRFPDVPAMIKTLHENGVHFMISIWPNMHDSTDNYAEMLEQNCLLPKSDLYNAFSKEARDLYWKQVYEGLFSKGVDSWWCDSSELVTPEWNKMTSPEPDKGYMEFHESARKIVDEENTNAYPLMHSKTIYEGQRSVTSNKRVVNLTRSCYTGQQKYGTIIWSGDICAKWKTLKDQIPAGLSLCASGMPYWTLDIGAFFVKRGEQWFWNGDFEEGCQDLGYRELYTRWFQLGTFLPVFRAHGTDTRREVWNFGEEGEVVYDTLVAFAKLRTTLLPYLYSLGARVTLQDDTMLRLLAFDFIQDKKVYDIKDQFMFGPSLMVCPVTDPMYYGPNSTPLSDVSKTRQVYLPEGTEWYDFWTNEKYSGGQTIEAKADLATLPLYVKAGSILPMTEAVDHSGEVPQDHFEVRVYAGCDGEFTLYQDERDTYNYESGNYTLIKLTWDDKASALNIGERIGSYEGMPDAVSFDIRVIGE